MAQNQTNCCHFPTSFSGLLTAQNPFEINLNFSNNGTMRTRSALHCRGAGGFQLYEQEPLWNLASAFKATPIPPLSPLLWIWLEAQQEQIRFIYLYWSRANNSIHLHSTPWLRQAQAAQSSLTLLWHWICCEQSSALWCLFISGGLAT